MGRSPARHCIAAVIQSTARCSRDKEHPSGVKASHNIAALVKCEVVPRYRKSPGFLRALAPPKSRPQTYKEPSPKPPRKARSSQSWLKNSYCADGIVNLFASQAARIEGNWRSIRLGLREFTDELAGLESA